MTRFLTHVALERPSALSASGLIEEMRRFARPHELQGLAPIAPPAKAPETALVVSVNGVGLVAMIKDRPLPREIWAQGADFGAEDWPETAARMERTLAHATVALVEAPEDLKSAARGAMAVSLAAAALAGLFRAPGAVFAESGVLSSGARFVAQMERLLAGEAPAEIWIGCALRREAGGAGALTRGLRPFIGRELHLRPCGVSGPALRRRLIELGREIIDGRALLRDGETLSLPGGSEPLRARHLVASPLTGEPVVELTPEATPATADEPILGAAPLAALGVRLSPRRAAFGG